MKGNKSIEIPMTIGVILHGIAVIIYLIGFFAQKAFYPSEINVSRLVMPADFFMMIVNFLLYVIFMLVMLTTNGESNRTNCIIMIIAFAVIRIISPYVNMVSSLFNARMGVDHVAAASIVSSTMNLIVSPFATIASILVIVAVSRYGISSPEQNLVIS